MKNLSKVGEEYKKWVLQFEKRYNHIYKGERRVVPKGEIEWIMSMFHNDLTKVYQNADTMYQQISKRYL